MNAEIKQKWLTALRSGEYIKGTHVLKVAVEGEKPKHCCLGVLCELYIQETGKATWNTENIVNTKAGTQRVVLDTGADNEVHLPYGILTWAGLDSVSSGTMGGFVTDSVEDMKKFLGAGSLVNLNDNPESGDNFDLIAEAIEKYF